MEYREEPSYKITILSQTGKLVHDCILDSHYREDEIALQCKHQSDKIKEKPERENDVSNECVRTD